MLNPESAERLGAKSRGKTRRVEVKGRKEEAEMNKEKQERK